MIEPQPTTIPQLSDRAAQVLIANILSGRRELMQQLGLTAYDGRRDYNRVLGYPEALTIDNYLARYNRQDIAGRIVDLPAQDTWKKPPLISEDGKADTEFVKAWDKLEQDQRVFSKLMRADRVSGIGQYGVLYIGYRGKGKPIEPVEPGSLKSSDDIIFLRPFSEKTAEIKKSDSDHNSPRFGLPELYELNVDNDGTQGSSVDKLTVHWTRILHLADNRIDSDVLGVPRLMRVFNRLDDLLKYVGGGAEASWLNMRPGTLLTTQSDYDFADDDDARRDIQNQIEEYLHGMARMMTIEGADVKQLAGQMMDPKPGFEVEIALISAASGIPQRVLLGSAAGELAAAKEDTRQWFGSIASRQINYAEPEILRAFIDHQVLLGALPAPSSGMYNVGTQDDEGNWSWPPLFEMTAQEQAELIKTNADAAAVLKDADGNIPLTEPEQRELLGYEPVPESIQRQLASQIKLNFKRGDIDNETWQEWLQLELENA